MNYGLACAKLKPSDLQSPSPLNNLKTLNVWIYFERLRLEELMLGGRFGVHSERDQRALAADERSDEHALVEYMLSQMLETRERAITFRAFDRGVSLRRIFQVRANFEDRLYEELQGVRFESSSAAVELFLKLLEETFNAEQVEASVEEGAEGSETLTPFQGLRLFEELSIHSCKHCIYWTPSRVKTIFDSCTSYMILSPRT
ncbi:hypothetical protein EYC80_002704 [Monilinia laxa]|uniref:Uncharacterized protein n=1 Tax=Monilinia laxa TaxID=61186 RepID=A0A5N6K4Q3_MONLA|nr:hypothetical protein EYC80_002704 [Monilinia laxa]